MTLLPTAEPRTAAYGPVAIGWSCLPGVPPVLTSARTSARVAEEQLSHIFLGLDGIACGLSALEFGGINP